jgi:hypothetical protein
MMDISSGQVQPSSYPRGRNLAQGDKFEGSLSHIFVIPGRPMLEKPKARLPRAKIQRGSTRNHAP